MCAFYFCIEFKISSSNQRGHIYNIIYVVNEKLRNSSHIYIYILFILVNIQNVSVERVVYIVYTNIFRYKTL